jgi:hypothetical protein
LDVLGNIGQTATATVTAAAATTTTTIEAGPDGAPA